MKYSDDSGLTPKEKRVIENVVELMVSDFKKHGDIIPCKIAFNEGVKSDLVGRLDAYIEIPFILFKYEKDGSTWLLRVGCKPKTKTIYPNNEGFIKS